MLHTLTIDSNLVAVPLFPLVSAPCALEAWNMGAHGYLVVSKQITMQNTFLLRALWCQLCRGCRHGHGCAGAC